MLAIAHAIVVTSDSANMVGEAVSTGAPVLLFDLPKTYIRHRQLFTGLMMVGAPEALRRPAGGTSLRASRGIPRERVGVDR